MAQGVLNYADPKLRRRIRWRGMILVLLGISTLCFLVSVALDEVARRVFPQRHVAVELVVIPTLPPATSDPAPHMAAIQSPTFLTPIAARHQIPLNKLQRNLKVVYQPKFVLSVEFTDPSAKTAGDVSRDIASTYCADSAGNAIRIAGTAVAATRPHPWMEYLTYVKAVVNAVLLTMLMRTRFAQRFAWHDA